MTWQEILVILLPVLGLLAWVYNRIDKKFDQVFNELKNIREDIHGLDMRLTRLEGRFDERGYWKSRWEPKVKEKE